RRELGQVQTALSKVNLDTLSTQDHGLSPITIQWTFGETEIIPVHYLVRKADGLRNEFRSFVHGAVTDTRRAFEDLQRLIQQRYVISKCEEIVNDAQASLAQDIDLYFQNVYVYRTGVFASRTKTSIGKLGLGEKLDELDRELTDEDKESIKITLKQDLVLSFDETVATATTQVASILERGRSVLNDMGAVQIESLPSM